MKLKQFVMSILCASFITGCTQFAEINQQVGEWAGKMIELRDGQQSNTSQSNTSPKVERVTFNNYTNQLKSQSQVDTLFVKLKRELDLKTNEAVPNVYYKLQKAEVDPRFYPHYYTTNITLGKEGNKTIVRWDVYATEEYAKWIEKKLRKAIK